MDNIKDDDALAPAIGCCNALKFSVLFFWLPLALAIGFFTWWRA